MSNVIHYALEIFTDSTLTNVTYGLKSGVFRFVTDRPKYNIDGWYAYGEIWCDVDSPTILGGTGRIGFEAISPGTTWTYFYINIWHKSHNPFNPNQTGIYWANSPSPGIVNIFIDTTTTVSDVVNGNLTNISGTPLFTLSEITPGTIITQTTYAYFTWIVFLHNYIPYDISGILPTYSAYEIDKNGVSVSGQPVNANFYEDFLTKEAFSVNPLRLIDIISCGTYSTDNTFAFKIKNNNKFWNFCLDPLNTGSYDAANAINLIGRSVILWVTINDVFYQYARGRVSNNPYTEIDYEIQVNDDATLIHKVLPPVVQTKTISSELQDSIAGTPIPIIFGDVPYSKILKKAVENQYLKVSTNGNFCAAINYVILSNSYSANQRCKIDLLNGTQQFAADQLAGYYLSVASGLNASTQISKIVSNDVSVLYTPTGYFSSYKTTIYLDSLLVDSNGLLIAAAATFAPSTNNWFDSTDLAWTLHYIIPVSASAYAVQNTWWFQVSTFAVNTFISNLTTTPGLGLSYKVWTYDSNLKLYLDISSVVNLTQSELSLIANSAQADGKVTVLEPIDFEMVEFGFISFGIPGFDESVTDKDAIAAITNKSRLIPFNNSPNAGYKFTNNVSVDAEYDLRAKYKLSILANTYDDIFFLADADWRWNNTGAYNAFAFWGIHYYLYDQYNNLCKDTWDTQKIATSIDAVPYGGVGVYYKYKLNLIPNSYYPANQIAGDNISLFSFDADSQSPWNFTHYPYSTHHSFKNFLKGTSAYDGTKDLSRIGAFYMDCRVRINQVPGSVEPFTIWLKQMTLLGSRIVETITGDVFTSAQGETVNNDGVTPTNNVYTVFRHILEYYDGIPAQLIDYGNLHATRGNDSPVAPEGTLWHVGHTLTERKNSIEYLSELCAHTFVGMFGTRTGKRGIKSFQNLAAEPVPTVIYDASIILNQSVESYKKSDISQLFNNFLINYSYDPALQTFLRSFFVANIDKFSSFPIDTEMEVVPNSLATSTTSVVIGTGDKTLTTQTCLDYKTDQDVRILKDTSNYMIGRVISYNITTGVMIVSVGIVQGSGTYSNWDINRVDMPTWYTCFGGLLGSYNFSSVGYAESKVIWDKCRASYVSNKVIKQAQSDVSDLSWFIDRSLFDSTSTWGTGDKSSAYYFLRLLSQWTTISKNIVTFSVPINSSTILEELLNYEGFSDIFYTNGKQQNGWVTGIELNTAEDSIRLTMTLLPVEVQNAIPQPYSTLSRLISVQAAPLTNSSIL